MKRTAQVTISDQRKDAQSLATELKRVSWYQSLVQGVGVCVDRFRPITLCVVYVDPAGIRDLNRRYRGIDRVTDVLSFAYADNQGNLIEGEIVICPVQAQKQRHRFRTTEQQEFARLFYHGLLHILGYDHVRVSDRRIMRSHEACLMKQALI